MKQIFRFLQFGTFLSAVLLAPGVSAQDRFVVEGVVKDTGGEPLIGVSVVEVGTTNGVNTDLKGNYRIQVVSEPNCGSRMSDTNPRRSWRSRIDMISRWLRPN